MMKVRQDNLRLVVNWARERGFVVHVSLYDGVCLFHPKQRITRYVGPDLDYCAGLLRLDGDLFDVDHPDPSPRPGREAGLSKAQAEAIDAWKSFHDWP